MLWKCCTKYVSKFGILSSGHRTGKGEFSLKSQRKAVPKNFQTTTQLHSSHTLANAQISPSEAPTVHELRTSDIQAGFRKGRGTRDQTVNIPRIIEKAREFQKNIYFCFTDYAKAFDCIGITTNWKILKEMRIPGHLTCHLRSLYVGQEATVRTGHGKMDWFQIGKGEHQGCILSPCLFNFYAEYIMQNAGLDEAKAGINITGRSPTTSDMEMTPL